MPHQVALSPGLKLGPAEFVAAWNDTPACRQTAQAELVKETPKGFPLDLELVRQGLIYLTIAGGVIAVDVLKDLLKDQVKKLVEASLAAGQKPPSIQVQKIPQPDGSVLFVVVEE